MKNAWILKSHALPSQGQFWSCWHCLWQRSTGKPIALPQAKTQRILSNTLPILTTWISVLPFKRRLRTRTARIDLSRGLVIDYAYNGQEDYCEQRNALPRPLSLMTRTLQILSSVSNMSYSYPRKALILACTGRPTILDDATELFGNFTQQPKSNEPNGYVALAKYDRPELGGNQDGLIDERDKIWGSLQLWMDENHGGLSDPSELVSLENAGTAQASFDVILVNSVRK